MLVLTLILHRERGESGAPGGPPHGWRALFAPFGIANNYGLFAVMTTARDEIIVEGSNDGSHWLRLRILVQTRQRLSRAAGDSSVPAASGLADVVRRARHVSQQSVVREFLRAAAAGRAPK